MTHGEGDAVDAACADGHVADDDGDTGEVAGPADAGGAESESDPNLDALAREDWRAALAAAGELTPAVVDAVISTHGARGRRAIEAVSEERVKQYRDFTVVVGYRAEHVVEGGGCDCEDAAYNLDPSDPDEQCWHALAVDAAERLDRVDHHDMWYSEVRDFL